MSDNRKYQYSVNSVTSRSEYPIILKIIPKGKKVIDLACGDGSLLALLKEKGVSGYGIEKSLSGVKSARAKGLEVTVGSVDRPLAFPDNFFDYAICNVTLQMVTYPDVLLKEMMRISKKQIISFPNFAYLPNRLELLFKGRMPKTMLIGHTWDSTGFLHQLSHLDFLDYCQEHKIKISKLFGFYPPRFLFIPQNILRLFPSLFLHVGIYLTQKK